MTPQTEEIKIQAPHPPGPERFGQILEIMRKKGRPVIRAIASPEGWKAIEGSHRLAAAAYLSCGLIIQAESSLLEIDWTREDTTEEFCRRVLRDRGHPGHAGPLTLGDMSLVFDIKGRRPIWRIKGPSQIIF
jgi:hypothetical protein